jgi:hypothetical protein
MATTTGKSVLGLQRIGSFSTTTEGWELRFASQPPQDRLTRLGTGLHCRFVSNNRFPVIKVYKIFGGGIAPATLAITQQASTELWVRWFVPNIVWTFERPD